MKRAPSFRPVIGKLLISHFALGVVILLELGCSKSRTESEKQGAIHTAPQQPRAMPEGSPTEERSTVEITDLLGGEVANVYVSFGTWYHGSDTCYHYVLSVVDNTVYRISRSHLSDEELVTLYRKKIARERSRIPGMHPEPRSKAFLDWLKNTIVDRVPGIDNNEDW
jgi:hypothetical protein